MALRAFPAIELGNKVSDLLFHLLESELAPVPADSLIRVNLLVTWHIRPLYRIGFHDLPTFEFCLKGCYNPESHIAPSPIRENLERINNSEPSLTERFPVGHVLSTYLGQNVPGLCHDVCICIRLIPALEDFFVVNLARETRLVNLVGEDVHVRAVADESPVCFVKIGELDDLGRSAVGGDDDFAV